MIQFLASLSRDPKKRDKFAKNPDAVLKDEPQLAADIKAVLKSRDPSKLAAMLKKEITGGVIW